MTTTTMKRPSDAELVKLLTDAAEEYEHGAEYNLSRVPRDEERMNNIAISRARQCRDAAYAAAHATTANAATTAAVLVDASIFALSEGWER